MQSIFKGTTAHTFRFIDANVQKHLDFLFKICFYEARAYDKHTIDQMVDYIFSFLQKKCFQHTPNEFLNIASIPLRAKILAGFLLDAD